MSSAFERRAALIRAEAPQWTDEDVRAAAREQLTIEMRALYPDATDEFLRELMEAES